MARFAVSDSQDQSAAVWIVTFLLLSYTTLTTVIRGFVKLTIMGLDDGVASIAQLFTYGYVVCIIYTLMHGFARVRPQTEEGYAEPQYGKVSETWKIPSAPVTDADKIRHYKQASYCTS